MAGRFDDGEDWVGTPPEGRHSRDRARPEFWLTQRPPQVALAGIVVVVVVLAIVLALG